MASKFEIGGSVTAITTITESGILPGDPEAKMPAANYIHALPGDTGKVVHVDEEGYPTVKFDKTGTATVVSAGELA